MDFKNSMLRVLQFIFPINTTYSNVSGTIRGYGNGSLDGLSTAICSSENIY